MSSEEIIAIVKVFSSSKEGSLLITIPKEIRERWGYRAGQYFLVKTEGDPEHWRLIYEPVGAYSG